MQFYIQYPIGIMRKEKPCVIKQKEVLPYVLYVRRMPPDRLQIP